VTSDRLEGTYDLVMMIDVAEHIVSTEAFDRCVANLAGVVAPGGILLVGPLLERGARHLFYVRFWSTGDVLEQLPTFDHLGDVTFRNGMLASFRRPRA
jgi:hypothetical protein